MTPLNCMRDDYSQRKTDVYDRHLHDAAPGSDGDVPGCRGELHYDTSPTCRACCSERLRADNPEPVVRTGAVVGAGAGASSWQFMSGVASVAASSVLMSIVSLAQMVERLRRLDSAWESGRFRNLVCEWAEHLRPQRTKA
jgi:hypothetical protein